MASISEGSRPSIPNSPTGLVSLALHSLDQHHSLRPVDFVELHFDDFVIRRLYVPAHEARLDRQLAVAAVYQRQQVDRRGPAVVEQRVHGRADRPPRVQYIGRQDDVPARHREPDFRGVHHRLCRHGRKIVAVQSDIQNAHRNLDAFERLDLRRQPLRDRHAAPADSDERQSVQILALLQNFVRQPDQRPVDLGSAHQLALLTSLSHRGAPTDRVPQALWGRRPRLQRVSRPACLSSFLPNPPPANSPSCPPTRAPRSQTAASSSQEETKCVISSCLPSRSRPRSTPPRRTGRCHPSTSCSKTTLPLPVARPSRRSPPASPPAPSKS